MTKEQKETIKKDIDRAIAHIAKANNVHNDEVESILIDDYVDEDDFVVIPWPEIQAFMMCEGFENNVSLANDEWSLEKYGSSAYFVNKKWLKTL